MGGHRVNVELSMVYGLWSVDDCQWTVVVNRHRGRGEVLIQL